MVFPILNKNIDLFRINVNSSESGKKAEVCKLEGHQKKIPATIVNFPFYDSDKSKVRS